LVLHALQKPPRAPCRQRHAHAGWPHYAIPIFPQLWFRVPAKIYHKAGCLEEALSDLRGKERAIVITGGLL